jgi:hypothetical protein
VRSLAFLNSLLGWLMTGPLSHTRRVHHPLDRHRIVPVCLLRRAPYCSKLLPHVAW